jgi:hypothetical protein
VDVPGEQASKTSIVLISHDGDLSDSGDRTDSEEGLAELLGDVAGLGPITVDPFSVSLVARHEDREWGDQRPECGSETIGGMELDEERSSPKDGQLDFTNEGEAARRTTSHVCGECATRP